LPTKASEYLFTQTNHGVSLRDAWLSGEGLTTPRPPPNQETMTRYRTRGISLVAQDVHVEFSSMEPRQRKTNPPGATRRLSQDLLGISAAGGEGQLPLSLILLGGGATTIRFGQTSNPPLVHCGRPPGIFIENRMGVGRPGPLTGAGGPRVRSWVGAARPHKSLAVFARDLPTELTPTVIGWC